MLPAGLRLDVVAAWPSPFPRTPRSSGGTGGSTAEGLLRFQRFKLVRAVSSCFEQFPELPLRG
eukprot:7482703-Alexandrium_andersonii.AAC.1